MNHKLNWAINDGSNNFVEYFVSYCDHVLKISFYLEESMDMLQNINGLVLLHTEYKIKIPENIK